MSLYGTGRREGIIAVLALVLITAAVHVLGVVLRINGEWELASESLSDGLRLAGTPALAAVTFYRFLKSLGRSRYAAFLGGAAYAMSPWLTACSAMPREQLAAALAPLALEVACRSARPDDRRRWLPWAGLGLAAPFFAGITTVGLLGCTVAALRLLGGTNHLRRDSDLRAYGRVTIALLGGALLGASFVLVDPGRSWLLTSTMPTSVEVLAAHRAPSFGLDAAAFLRLPGPVLLLFAVLGLLRRQRHASRLGWSVLALMGALPTIATTIWPILPRLLDDLPRGSAGIPAAAFWLTLIGTTVLGAAGLDDFLESPMRRPKALPTLLLAAALVAPTLLLVTPVPMRELPLVCTFLALATLLSVWRSVGMLRLKNVLGVVAVIALVVPAMQVLTVHVGATPTNLPAAPGAETDLMPVPNIWQQLATQPAWYYSGALAALLLAFAAALLRRKTNASPAPAKARPAIMKKAPPSKRS